MTPFELIAYLRTNSVLEFNSWAYWASYYSRNYVRLEYAGFSIPSLNYPPRYKRNL
jgi:hypothetical protein